MAKTSTRKKMIAEKNGNKTIRINGRQFELVPRKDGRFNLIAKGQRGAAGSTALIGRKEAAALREELKDFDVQVVQFESDGETIVFKDYVKEGSEIVDSLDDGSVKIDYEVTPEGEASFTLPARFEASSEGVKDNNVSVEIEKRKGSALVTFGEETFEGEVELKLPEDGFTHGNILDAEIINSDIDGEEIKETLNLTENKPLAFRHYLSAKIIKGGSLAGHTVTGAGTYATDSMTEWGLNKMREGLTDINNEARKDILLGEPVRMLNSGPLFLAKKGANLYYAAKAGKEAEKKQTRYDRVKSFENFNRKALKNRQDTIVSNIKKEELKPLEQQYGNIMSQLNDADQKRETLSTQMKAMKQHPLLKTTDAQIESRRRSAAKNKNVEELSRIAQFVEARNKAQQRYTETEKQYSSLPTMKTVKPQLDKIKNDTYNVKRKIDTVYKTMPEGFTPPYNMDAINPKKHNNKVLSLLTKRMGDHIVDANLDREGFLSQARMSRYSRF